MKGKGIKNAENSQEAAIKSKGYNHMD